MSRRCVFLDRDGIVNVSPGDGYVERWESFALDEAVVPALQLAAARGYALVVVTNQRGVALGRVTSGEVERIHENLTALLRERYGVDILAVYFCPHDNGQCDCRKPRPGMLLRAAREHDLELSASWMIGDGERDIEAGHRAGCRTIRVCPGETTTAADYRVRTVAELAPLLARLLVPRAPPGTEPDLLLAVLRAPACVRQLDARSWGVLTAYARGTRLTARLAMVLDEAGLTDCLPGEARAHFDAALRRADGEALRADWDAACVRRTLAPLGVPVVLLKGAAYRALGLPIARGRLYNDLDLLVPEADLPGVENTLREAGWERAAMPPHQERYFRRWMHELPPFVHAERGVKVDVHHNILPRIDRVRVEAPLLFADASKAPDGARVLSPADMLLHNSVHLFRRGDFGNGLRDLLDFRDMALWFGREPAFWNDFLDRTTRFGLQTPVYLSLRYAHRLLGASWPDAVRRRTASWRPVWPPMFWLDRLVRAAVTPPRIDGRNRRRNIAHWLLARYPLNLWRKSILPKLQRFAGRGNA